MNTDKPIVIEYDPSKNTPMITAWLEQKQAQEREWAKRSFFQRLFQTS